MLTDCYFPSGVLSPHDRPCNALAAVSACCAASDIWLDSGYCIGATGSSPNVISRGSCTDSTFGSSCPQRCANVNPDGGAPLTQVSDGANSGYCCSVYDFNAGACEAAEADGGSKAPFTLPNARMVTNRTDGSVTLLEQVLGAPAGEVVTYTVTATATAAATARATGVGSGISTGTLLGGIVAPLVVLLLMAAGGMWYLWHMMRIARRQVTEARFTNMVVSAGQQGGPASQRYDGYYAERKDAQDSVFPVHARYEVGTNQGAHELDAYKPSR